MYRAPNTLVAIDAHSHVMDMSTRLEPFIEGQKTREKKNVIVKTMTVLLRDLVDDLITENLYWTEATTVATPERYASKFKIKDGYENEVLDLFDHLIIEVEGVLFDKELLPSWSFFEVVSRSAYIIIHSYGDYRVEDWMKRHGKRIKRTRFCSKYGGR